MLASKSMVSLEEEFFKVQGIFAVLRNGNQSEDDTGAARK